jgi:hypothetical protein
MQETDKGQILNNNLSRSPRGLEKLASMTKNEKRSGDREIYSDDDLSTQTQTTLESLC